MKNIIKKGLQGLLLVPVLALGVSMVAPIAEPAYAAFDSGIKDGKDSAKSDDQPEELTGEEGVFKTVTNVLLFIIGAVSVIMLIIGGIRYTISGGDQAQVKAAKDTILYAIIGIVVAILAYALVDFVVSSFAAE